jgi:hypothetical protein
MKCLLEPINTRRRLGGWEHIVDIHFISHAFIVLTASCCASSTFDLGVHRAWRKRDLRNHYRNIPARGGNQVLGSVTRGRLVDLQLLLRRICQLTAQEL